MSKATVTISRKNGEEVVFEDVVKISVGGSSEFATRGGVYGVEALKLGISAIAGGVKLATNPSSGGSVFDLLQNGWSAIQRWREMWNEVRELDWDDAVALGKHVASELMPVIGGLFGMKAPLIASDKFRALEPFCNTRSEMDDEVYAKLGNIAYTEIFPQFAVEGLAA
jgi:hypothetical protein